MRQATLNLRTQRKILAQTALGALVSIEPHTGNKHLLYAPPAGDAGDLNGRAMWLSNSKIVFSVGVDEFQIASLDYMKLSSWKADAFYSELHPTKEDELWAMAHGRDSSELVQLKDGKRIKTISVPMRTIDGPNANGLIVGGTDDGLKLIHANDGRVQSLTSEPGDSEPLWAADGKQIAFSRRVRSGSSATLCITTLKD